MKRSEFSSPPEEEGEHFHSLMPQPDNFISSSTGSMELVGLTQEQKITKVTEFETLYRQPAEQITVAEMFRERVKKYWSKFSFKSLLLRNFPFVKSLEGYTITKDFPNDIIAGLTTGVMMIPQGMAFAALSTLPPITGLYIAFFANITYAIFGSSHHNSWGCIAILSIMMGSILDKYDNKILGASTVDNCNRSSSLQSEEFGITASYLDSTSTFYAEMNATHLFENTTFPYTRMPALAALSMETRIEVAGAVSLICGITLVLFGKLGFGKLSCFMSDSLITGFTVGASFHVASSQLKTAFGLTLPRESGIFKLLRLWYSILVHMHESNIATLIFTAICMLIIYIIKRFINEKFKTLRIPVPIELFVVILATVISANTDLSKKYTIDILKDIPVGIASPKLPNLALGRDYIAEGMIIIIVAFAQTVAMAKTMGQKHNYPVDSNQEMFACGMVSVVSAFFSGYISGASVSLTVVQDGAGGKTQVASLFSAGLVLLVIMLIGPYFYYLPKCVLAAIVIVNLRSMFLKLLTIPDLWRKSRVDAMMWVITCASVVILDADIGLLVGIIASIIFVLIRSQVASVDITSKISVGDTVIWRSTEKYFGGQDINGIKVIRINSPLYFANADIVTGLIFTKIGMNPIKEKRQKSFLVSAHSNKIKVPEKMGKHVVDTNEVTVGLTQMENTSITTDMNNDKKSVYNGALRMKVDQVNVEKEFRDDLQSHIPSSADVYSHSDDVDKPLFSTLIVDLSGVSFLDLMGVKALELLINGCKSNDIAICFSNVHEKCVDLLQTSGFMAKHSDRVFLTTEAAIADVLHFS